jgi:Arc/MetJ-type ribon-helix-helix transcriptional regulator
MRKEYDFTQAEIGPVEPIPTGKTRITIRLDDDILEWFRQRVHAGGGGNSQSLINQALRDTIQREPLEDTLRRVVREELQATALGAAKAAAKR